MADVIAEYRTCCECKSTRPFMHPLQIEGEQIVIFHDPDATSPVFAPDEYLGKWDNLLEAIAVAPVADVAELRRNGVVLARAFVAIDGVLGWHVLPPAVLGLPDAAVDIPAPTP